MRRIGLLISLILMASACTASDDSLPTQLKLPAPTKTLIPTQAQALATATLPDVDTQVPPTESVSSQQVASPEVTATSTLQPTDTQEPESTSTEPIDTQEPESTSTEPIDTQEPKSTSTELTDTQEPESTSTETDTVSTPVAAQPSDVPNDCILQDDWDEYTVQRGDNLVNIASRTGSTIDELTAANCLDNPNRLRVGQVLFVPNSPQIATQEPTISPTSQEATSGDSPSVSVSIKKTYISDKGFAIEYPVDWNLLDIPSTSVKNTILTSFEYTLGEEIPQNRWTDEMVSVTVTVFQEETSDILSSWTQEVQRQLQGASNITQVDDPEPFLTDSNLEGQRIDYVSSDETRVVNLYFIINNHKVQLSIGGNISLAIPIIESIKLSE